MNTSHPRGLAVVTGASAGIGKATAHALHTAGYTVIAGARRLPTQTPRPGELTSHQLDVTDDASVAALAKTIAGHDEPLTLLVNNAGIPTSPDPVATSDVAEWQRAYDVNVLGVLRMTQALLPNLEANRGHVVVIGSTVGHVAYEKGAGYAASKHALTALASSLRLELCGTPVRVTEIAPGMMRGDADGGEFMRARFHNDKAAIDAVYQGVDAPLTPADIADIVTWCATRPAHVDIDLLMVRPLAQAAQHKVHRTT
ncbi:SDR family oxidoreductase [Streptomyces goshikiensis]|uniref:SDR family oxidoreductase n=1 Tax=Streptomyces goshikiensis TaxID=1942 RepID=UPI0036A7F06C